MEKRFASLCKYPKLFPFLCIRKLCHSLGLRITLTRITRSFPNRILDIKKIGGIRFGVRLFRPEDTDLLYETYREPFLNYGPKKGDTVLDLGAHIGTYTLLFSRQVGNAGRVIAFEPEPGNRQLLLWNVRLNDARNVEVRSEAVANFTGVAKLRKSDYPGRHSLAQKPTDQTHSREIAVRAIKLDDMKIAKVDLVKMDVEGYETQVLFGGEKTICSLRPRLIIEVHSAHGKHCSVCRWLGERHFATRVLGAHKSRHWVEAS